MEKVKVSLRPIINNINLPTIIKSAILPGKSIEGLFIGTLVGEILYKENNETVTFLDIRKRIIKLGSSNGGYDERGLLGLAFHPSFNKNGLFYLHYSVIGTQGPGALQSSYIPNPCDPKTLNLKWTNREINFDHIDTIEEWVFQPNGTPKLNRTLLNIRRPFSNHNGVNTLNFSPETGKLIFTNGDGGSGYDPFNLSQDEMEIAGKIIEIDVAKNNKFNNTIVATQFNELPIPTQEILKVMAKGVRNIVGISFQYNNGQYIKYVGNVGQGLVESIYSFTNYKSLSVLDIVKNSTNIKESNKEGFINFGWRGWEGSFPTCIINGCTSRQALDIKTVAFYNDAVNISINRINPLTCYYHNEPRIDKFSGTAITRVQPYMGNQIPNLGGKIVFTDLLMKNKTPTKGVLAYTNPKNDCKLNDYSIIEIDYNFKSSSTYFISLGTNIDQSKLYLGVYESIAVTDLNKGTVYEIIPSSSNES